MATRITVNGKEYRSVDEMPPDVRAAYERAMSMLVDRDGNGVPDILEGGDRVSTQTFDDAGQTVVTAELTSSRYIVNGREYERLEDIPPDLRQLIREAGASRQSPGGSSQRVLPPSHSPWNRPPEPSGGLTIHLTRSTLFALLAALVVAAALAWVAMR